MIERIKITDNEDSSLYYLKNVPAFANGKEYKFTDGVNVLVGENGSGKTTLLKLLRRYLMVYYEWCDKGAYNCNIRNVYKKISLFDDNERELYKGVDVYADYVNNTFNLVPFEERTGKEGFIDFEHPIDLHRNLALNFEGGEMSKGQQMNLAIYALFEKMFDEKNREILLFDYKKQYTDYPEYLEYIESHQIPYQKTWTVLLDEPDCSVDIDKLEEIYDILTYKKKGVQLITAVHNPFLILKLAKSKKVNLIEMSEGYVDKIKERVEQFNKL